MEDIQIWKGDTPIASLALNTNAHFRVLHKNPKWEEAGELYCAYFPRLRLSPPVVWEILSGAALSKFFDHCTVRRPGVHIEDVRYVHGRAETMRGKPTISTVLLVKPNGTPPPEVWIGYMPAIYEEFMREYGTPQKSP